MHASVSSSYSPIAAIERQIAIKTKPEKDKEEGGNEETKEETDNQTEETAETKRDTDEETGE